MIAVASNGSVKRVLETPDINRNGNETGSEMSEAQI